MHEYVSLGHSQVETDDTQGFYLPHHAVIKPSSSTTSVRVVFDGSVKSSSGLSLNDALMTRPTIQDDILTLLLRFRVYTYVLTGDIEKMYRQFLIKPEDPSYQHILWRNGNNDIATFELNTITFGLSSVPYLAIRCLHQLVDDEKANFPRATTILKRDLYMDDLLTGANNYEEALSLRNEIITLLRKGGLNIRQWASNEPLLLKGLSENQIHPKYFGDSTTVKTLGVSWDAHQDYIKYSANPHITTKPTKRSILSAIAKIFDPLGLLGPVIITTKKLIQQLWQLRLDWDESLPANLHMQWITFVNQLQQLNNIFFSRSVIQNSTIKIELHGFCDASEQAYGACLYVRTITTHGKIATNLLCAKSRVAPLSHKSCAVRALRCYTSSLLVYYCSQSH